MTKKPTTFRLSADLKLRLDELAKRERRTASSLIGQAVEDFLSRKECPDIVIDEVVDQFETVYGAVLKHGQGANSEELKAVGSESCSLLFKLFVQSDDDCCLELMTKDKTITFEKKSGKTEIKVPWRTWAKMEPMLRSDAKSNS